MADPPMIVATVSSLLTTRLFPVGSVMAPRGQQSFSPDKILAQLLPADCPAASRAVLPSESALIQIAQSLRQLVFPQLWASETHSDVPGVRSAMAQRHFRKLQLQLKEQIGLAMEHDRLQGPRLHHEHPREMDREVDELTTAFLSSLPQLQKLLQSDLNAAFERDPAARSRDEIIICYPGIQAIVIYRMAHRLLQLGIPCLPRMLTEWAHRETGIDIHPGAHIGPGFFIDHGTGVVIGETSSLGQGVTLYQGVTLGAWSFPRDESGQLIRGSKRHPTLESGVTVYSNATILGGTTVIGSGSQVGASVTLSRSIPPNTIVTLDKPSLRFREAA